MFTLSSLVWVMVAFVVMTGASLALRGGIRAALHRRPMRSRVSGALGPAVRRASLLWCLAVGLWAANEIALDLFLPPRFYLWTGRLLEAVVVLSIVVILAGISGFATTRIDERAVSDEGVKGFVETTA